MDDPLPPDGEPGRGHMHNRDHDIDDKAAAHAVAMRKARGQSGTEDHRARKSAFNLHDKSEDASVVAAVKAHLAIKAKANARAKAKAKAKSKAELDAHLKDSGGKSFVDDEDDDDDVRGDRRQRRLQASEGLPPPKTKPSAGFLGSVGGHGLSVGAAKKEMTPYEKKLSDIRAAWFINAQWALGAEGTGAPVHYHNTAWNALLYGAKKWMLYKPRDMIMSNRQILEYTETDLVTFATDADATGIGEKVSGSRSTLTLLHLRTL